MDSQGSEEAEVQGASLFSLPAVREDKGLFQEIPALPHLFPGIRFRGVDSGCNQVKLVRVYSAMSQSDSIGDMLTRIRNANMTRADSLEMPCSKVREAIARILKREGFVRDFTAETKAGKRTLRLYLKYDAGNKRSRVIRGLRRVSKPGLRRYVSRSELRPVLHGTGIAIISTSRGILTDREARDSNVGGEWLCSVW